MAFQAAIQKDPDLPSYVDTLTEPDQEGFYNMMWKEVEELEGKNMWMPIQWSEMQSRGRTALLSTWVFQCKQFPDGLI